MRARAAAVAALSALAALPGEPVRAEGPAPAAPPWRPALCRGAEVPVDAASHDRPFVHMRMGSVSGAFLIDTGATRSSLDAASYGLRPGGTADATGSSLPTVSGGTRLRVADLSGQPGPSRVTGIIGTDYLSTRTVEFDYRPGGDRVTLSEGSCGDLSGRGLVGFDETGWYGPPGGPPLADADVPAAFMEMAGVRFRAWIDTGFYEAVPGRHVGAVRANAALLAALRDAGVGMEPAGDVESVACDGTRRTERTWTARGRLREAGSDDADAVVDPVLQEQGPDACGGPGNVRAPLAMLGAAWLRRWGRLVVDGPGRRVWMGRGRD